VALKASAVALYFALLGAMGSGPQPMFHT
jgi:hypothetical protein